MCSVQSTMWLGEFRSGMQVVSCEFSLFDTPYQILNLNLIIKILKKEREKKKRRRRRKIKKKENSTELQKPNIEAILSLFELQG